MARDISLAGDVDDREQARDQEREQEQARLSDRAVQRQLRPVVRGPALRRHHAHPDARRDAMRMELPGHIAPHAEIAGQKAHPDHRQHDQHVIMRAWIRHWSPRPAKAWTITRNPWSRNRYASDAKFRYLGDTILFGRLACACL